MSADDLHLLREGTHRQLDRILGCHWSRTGTQFAVWAPNARSVSVIGDWNGWQPGREPLVARADGSGIWSGMSPGPQPGDVYKFHIESLHGGYRVDKADPLAQWAQEPPATGSRVGLLTHRWQDGEWMQQRAARQQVGAPVAIYEVHAGSWRRGSDGRFLGYRELAPLLADHVQALGFTHVELMPLAEHPFYGSWGYQGTGYFAPTARYGTPDDFAAFVDHLHQRGIGVILDWVPSHFPTDEHGLQFFDGTHLYEHADPRQGFHPDWHSSIFNYGRGEVSSFLISSALSWLRRFHIDGLRVDAVASMLYLDYSRAEGQWVPNRHGGRENLEAIELLRRLNAAVQQDHPGVLTIAEESTAWPGVTRAAAEGGLGFSMKWNMGWMHDTLRWMQRPLTERGAHLDELSFSLVYAFDERFVLPLSHDEVVHGKGSLRGRMPGDAWQQWAGLRALYGWMWAHPGKKLLFMGGEFGQRAEWQHDGELAWHEAEQPPAQALQRLVGALNRLYTTEPALHAGDADRQGFEWVDAQDRQHAVLAFLRQAVAPAMGTLLVVCNLTARPHEAYRLGVPQAGRWQQLLDTDQAEFGGAGWGSLPEVATQAQPSHGRPCSLVLRLPPLATLILKWRDE